MEIQIRHHLEEEQAVLANFLYFAIYTPPDSHPPPLEIFEKPELAKYIQDWGQADDWAVFAVLDNQVLGACWTRCFPADDPGYGTIDPTIPELSIAVHPEFRGLGIGSRLLAELIKMIKSRYGAISLSVTKGNPAEHLYKRFGFLKIYETQDTIVMKKELTSNQPR